MHNECLSSTYYSFSDPKRINGCVRHVGWHTADGLPWGGHQSTAHNGAGQWKFAGHRPTLWPLCNAASLSSNCITQTSITWQMFVIFTDTIDLSWTSNTKRTSSLCFRRGRRNGLVCCVFESVINICHVFRAHLCYGVWASNIKFGTSDVKRTLNFQTLVLKFEFKFRPFGILISDWNLSIIFT